MPDFAWVCATFLAARDDWKEFYVVGHPDHYAGHGRALDQRWGIPQTMFFGNQNDAGQFHRSAYTAGKIHAIAAQLATQPLLAHSFAGVRYDCGSRHGFIKATFDYALEHEELRGDLLAYFKQAGQS